MTARQACEHTSKAYFLVLLSSLAIPSAPSLAQGAHHVHVQQPSGVRKACQPLEFETRKHRQERDQLGPAHAAEHARMRAAQCEVERGVRKVPAAGKVVSAAKSLKDDADIRAAVIARAAGQIQGSALATGPAVAPTATLAATAPDPLTFGRWSDPFVIPVVGVAAVLLHTGKVLFWSYDPVDYHNQTIRAMGSVSSGTTPRAPGITSRRPRTSGAPRRPSSPMAGSMSRAAICATPIPLPRPAQVRGKAR